MAAFVQGDLCSYMEAQQASLALIWLQSWGLGSKRTDSGKSSKSTSEQKKQMLLRKKAPPAIIVLQWE